MKKMLFTLVMGFFAVASTASASTSVMTSASATPAASVEQKEGSPSAAAMTFMNNMMKGVVELDSWYMKEVMFALAVMDDEGKELFKAEWKKALPEITKELEKELGEFEGVEFSIVSETIAKDGKTATVKMGATHGGKTEYQDIPMIKYLGKWRVNLDEFK